MGAQAFSFANTRWTKNGKCSHQSATVYHNQSQRLSNYQQKDEENTDLVDDASTLGHSFGSKNHHVHFLHHNTENSKSLKQFSPHSHQTGRLLSLSTSIVGRAYTHRMKMSKRQN